MSAAWIGSTCQRGGSEKDTHRRGRAGGAAEETVSLARSPRITAKSPAAAHGRNYCSPVTSDFGSNSGRAGQAGPLLRHRLRLRHRPGLGDECPSPTHPADTLNRSTRRSPAPAREACHAGARSPLLPVPPDIRARGAVRWARAPSRSAEIPRKIVLGATRDGAQASATGWPRMCLIVLGPPHRVD